MSKKDLILFVDDQAVARKYFSMMFGTEFDVLTASNADEAWTLIREHAEKLALVITDQRMPHHSGVDLLVVLRQRHPRIVRMLTTGYADLDEAIDSVNRGDIYCYVSKPWNIDELSLDIRRAIELSRLQKERDSLLDVHGSQLREVLSADRLRAYGFIAATCSGWIDRPLTATLAFWSDAMRHFHPRKPSEDTAQTQIAAIDQARSIMDLAADISMWLALRSPAAPSEINVVTIVTNVIDLCQFRPLNQPSLTINLNLDPRLLEAGLCAFGEYLIRSAARGGRRATISMGSAAAADGGIDIHIQAFCAGSVSPEELCDQITVEGLGLRAYFAFHHYRGIVSIREWVTEGGAVLIHIPPPGASRCRETTEDFYSALLSPW